MTKQYTSDVQLIGRNDIGIQAHSYLNGNIRTVRTADRDEESIYDVLLTQMGAFNNSGVDRWRNNTEGTLLASASRTTTTFSAMQTNHNAKGVLITIKVTTAGATGGLTPILQFIDPVSGEAKNYSNGAQQTSTNMFAHIFYPGSTSGVEANIATHKSIVLPRKWQLAIVHADTTSWTYSVGYSLIL